MGGIIAADAAFVGVPLQERRQEIDTNDQIARSYLLIRISPLRREAVTNDMIFPLVTSFVTTLASPQAHIPTPDWNQRGLHRFPEARG